MSASTRRDATASAAIMTSENSAIRARGRGGSSARGEAASERSSILGHERAGYEYVEPMAEGCCLARAQAPIQAFLRPAVWLPGVRRLHLAAEEWLIRSTTPQQSLEKLLEGVAAIAEAEHLEVRKVDRERLFVQLFSFTPGCSWLDVVEVQFRPGKEDGTTNGRITSFSSGVLPACCPLAFLFNVLFFWVPFSGNGFNTHRVNAIRESLQLDVAVTAETKCTCCPS